MKIRWGKEHGVLLKALLDRLNTEGIRYFFIVIMNYSQWKIHRMRLYIFEAWKMNA